MRNWGSDQGLTLLELLIVISVLTILLMAAAPSMRSLLDARKIDRLVTKLSAALELARSEAIRTNANVYVHNLEMSTATDHGWCVIISMSSSVPASCHATSTALGVIEGNQFPTLTISNNQSRRWFDPARSMVNQGMTYTLVSDSMTSEQNVKVLVSNKSRIRRCAEGRVSGYKSC